MDSFYTFYLTEALPLGIAKNTVRSAKTKKASKSLPYDEKMNKIFNGKDRLIFPFTLTEDDFFDVSASHSYKEFINALSQSHLSFPTEKYQPLTYLDYVLGRMFLVKDTKRKSPIKIMKVLNFELSSQHANPNTEGSIAFMFVNDNTRGVSPGEYNVIISRHPYDVAGMSTDRNWTSCMNLGTKGINYPNKTKGLHSEYVAAEIEVGSIVAYLVKKDEKSKAKEKLKKPFSRILAKPYFGKYNSKNYVYGLGTIYGVFNKKFSNFFQSWVSENINKMMWNLDLYQVNAHSYEDAFDALRDQVLPVQVNGEESYEYFLEKFEKDVDYLKSNFKFETDSKIESIDLELIPKNKHIVVEAVVTVRNPIFTGIKKLLFGEELSKLRHKPSHLRTLNINDEKAELVFTYYFAEIPDFNYYFLLNIDYKESINNLKEELYNAINLYSFFDEVYNLSSNVSDAEKYKKIIIKHSDILKEMVELTKKLDIQNFGRFFKKVKIDNLFATEIDEKVIEVFMNLSFENEHYKKLQQVLKQISKKVLPSLRYFKEKLNPEEALEIFKSVIPLYDEDFFDLFVLQHQKDLCRKFNFSKGVLLSYGRYFDRYFSEVNDLILR